MNTAKAIRDFSGRNPGLRLVGNVIPGSRNFPQAITRLFSIACVGTFVGGAYYLAGGDWRQLWQIRTFAAMLGLTFVVATRHVGFTNSLTGFTSALFGPAPTKSAELTHFNNDIPKWAIQSAHIFAVLNIIHNLPMVTDWMRLVQSMDTVVMGYLYAFVFGIILQSREKEGQRLQVMDTLVPVALLAVAYSAVQYLTH